ncbi:hypothetical protein L228DRAFT_268163 [Xylona heveae TC161]|uniref:Pyridoxal phosphate homeostasis protein n=1 Tax=Xylona heveae (strain CBS 132557 / TC161) TaxID=1328760 RepID=A0A165GZ06_XYLHT|nr:hypothetical protein L228DRAFT_268163 [Xylona heveae TC161]KZF22780.1 hypothetical protein L228DRAFT_268163 [Xylona heveae TC161]
MTTAAPTLEQVETQMNPQRTKQLADNLAAVAARIQTVNTANRNIRLIAVSKLKPASDILTLHRLPTPQLHFGENYMQELLEKAALLPRSIRWHFIGGLQSNKCLPLASQIPNLWCVSSVDSIKKADQLEKGRRSLVEKVASDASSSSTSSAETAPITEKLRIHVQINTSGEDAKSGASPGKEAIDLCRHVVEKCPHLELLGVMTIGSIARSRATTAETENEDFITLRESRDQIADELGIPRENLQLSMGMSNDFEGAISQGSDEVRVGTTIFGQRPTNKADARVV